MSDISLSQLASWENLYRAWQKASKGKRGKAEVATFEHQLEENLLFMQTSLLAGEWWPGGYYSFYVHDPKRRLISAAPFADRVVHHALCNLIEPVFERSFIVDSFANRVGKGNHRALERAQQFARRFPYVLSLDVRKFFPGIDHAILLAQLSRKVSDGEVLALIRRILESGRGLLQDETDRQPFPGDNLVDMMRPKGLPIGNLTSQFWANVFLNPLDHFIKRTLRCRGYVRYVDDMQLFADDKKLLWEWKQRVETYLYGLRLHIHDGAHPRPVTEGFGFLGFQVFPDHRRLKRRKGIQYQRHLKSMLKKYHSGFADADNVLDSVMAWNNHVSYGNTLGLRKQVFLVLPENLSTLARIHYQRILEYKQMYDRSH